MAGFSLRFRLSLMFHAVMAVVAFGSPVHSEGPTQQQIEEYAQRSKAARPEALGKAAKHLQAMRKKGPRSRTAESRQQWKMFIAGLEKQLEELENPLSPFYAPMHEAAISNALEPGGLILHPELSVSIGYLDNSLGGYWETLQVISEDEALVNLVRDGGTITRRVSSNMTESSTEKRRTLVYLQDYPLNGVVDKQRLEIKGIIYLGTKQYSSSTGVRTVPMIKLLDLSKHQELFTSRDSERTWTAKSGHTVDAMFVRSKRAKVTLMNSDGKSIDIPLDQLSDEDREYVREQLAIRMGK